MMTLQASKCSEIEGNGEIEAVGSIVNNLYISNRMLADKLDYSKDSVNALLLVKLLKGQFDSKESFNEAAKDVGVSLSKNYYAVAVFQSSKNTSPMYLFKTFIDRVVAHASLYNLEIFPIESLNQNQYHFVVGLEQDNPRYFENSLETLFFKENSIDGCLGLGELKSSTQQLFQSLFQATAALEYRFIKGNRQVIAYREIETLHNSNFSDYPQVELELFKAAIVSRNAKNYENSLYKLLSFFESDKTDLFTARCLFNDIINTLFKTSHNLGVSVEAISSSQLDVLRLRQFETMNDFIKLIKSVSVSIQKRIEEINNQINSNSISSILEYVDLHALETNFTVQLVCDRFNISPSNLSHQFKKQTGINISDYIGNIRIEYVKAKLRETDLPLKDIISDIGYSDPSGFIRKFKQRVGMTPGEYKKTCQLDKN